ncbi:MAG: PIG-L family deacetylase [Bacteroidaceae bacterium]|nr:PIG-L family deacetylase [Bacteroidaceae bacterium]
MLIISPHPDDEVLGCGGLMHSLVQTGKKVEVIIMSKGEAVHRPCCPDEENSIVQARVGLTYAANGVLGIAPEYIHRLDFPDGRFSSVKEGDEVVKALGDLIREIAPTEVFIPHPYENSPDHVAATRLAEQVLRNHIGKVYYYCVWTWYHMPIYKILLLKYRNARLLRVADRDAKNKAIDIYINNSAPCGVSYSGDLPKPLIHAARWKYELFFEA